MEQDIFREVYKQMHHRTCLFQKAILSSLCHCTYSHKTCIAEREGIRCNDDAAQQQCEDFLLTMKQQAQFTLKTTTKKRLSHVGNIRLQVGSLRGLRGLFETPVEKSLPIDDVFSLISRAKKEYNGLASLPFAKIIPHINDYEVRKRRSKRR